MKYIFLIFLFFLTSRHTNAQGLKGSQLTDSLLSELYKSKQDSEKVKIMIKISRSLLTTDLPVALKYADSALALSSNNGWAKGIGLAALSKGRIYRTTSDYAAGLTNSNHAYEIFDSLHLKPAMGDALVEIANIYERLGNYSKAIENHFKALTIYEEAGLAENIAFEYNNIGNSYYRLNDNPKAIDNYNRALNFHKKSNNIYGIASALDNLANVYGEQGEFQKVNENNLQALKMFESIHNEPAMGRIYNNRGNFMLDQNHFDSAMIYFEKALAIAQKLGIKSTLAYGNGGIADLYFKLAKSETSHPSLPDNLKKDKTTLLKTAFIYYSRALDLSEKAGDLENMMQYTAALSEIEEARGNFKKALLLFRQSIDYKDSIFNDENKAKISALEIQRLAEIKDNEITLLNKEKALKSLLQEKKDYEVRRVRNIQYLTIALLTATAIAIFIIALIQFRNNNHRRKANVQLQQEKEKADNALFELKSTQALLVQSEKMASLGELTAGIAHEIQNPLNFVNNFSELNYELISELKNEIHSKNHDEAISIANNIGENAQKIIVHGKRADAIVKSMLQHSRQNTGQKESTDINALADQYLQLSYQGIRVQNRALNVTINTVFDSIIGRVNVVPQDIGRVLLSLFNNAFYAVNEKRMTVNETYDPTVSLITRYDDDKIEIEVKDNGPGIPKKVMDKIFQPFFTTKPAGKGTGLGLSLSYDIIKAHGGIIKVESKEGEGSSFIIQIPSDKIRTK